MKKVVKKTMSKKTIAKKPAVKKPAVIKNAARKLRSRKQACLLAHSSNPKNLRRTSRLSTALAFRIHSRIMREAQ